MLAAWRTGISFGLTSGVITTLGLIVGLHSGTHSRLAVLGGILTIAVADALSDALGIHVSEEAKGENSQYHVWLSTLATFITKFIMAASFAVPILLLELRTAIIVSIAWGLSVLALLSIAMAKAQGERPLHVVGEHLGIAMLVILLTHWLGEWVAANLEP